MLEGRTRKTSKPMAAVFVLLLIIAGCQTSKPTSLTARELTVVDDDGNVLIRLGSTSGNGAITLYSKDGHMLVSIAARPAIFDVPAGGELTLWRSNDELLFSVYPGYHGPGIGLWSPGIDGERWLEPASFIIDTTADGTPRIRTESGELIVEKRD